MPVLLAWLKDRELGGQRPLSETEDLLLLY